MYIQYVGRSQRVVLSRIYALHVANAPNGAGDFTVTVQAEVSRPDGLKLQGGPGTCFGRLSQELRGEAEASRTRLIILIGDRNIKEYLGQHHPQIARSKEGVSLT